MYIVTLSHALFQGCTTSFAESEVASLTLAQQSSLVNKRLRELLRCHFAELELDVLVDAASKLNAHLHERLTLGSINWACDHHDDPHCMHANVERENYKQ